MRPTELRENVPESVQDEHCLWRIGETADENAGRWKYEKLPGAQWLQTWNTSFKVTHVQSGHTLSLGLGRILSRLELALPYLLDVFSRHLARILFHYRNLNAHDSGRFGRILIKYLDVCINCKNRQQITKSEYEQETLKKHSKKKTLCATRADILYIPIPRVSTDKVEHH